MRHSRTRARSGSRSALAKPEQDPDYLFLGGTHVLEESLACSSAHIAKVFASSNGQHRCKELLAQAERRGIAVAQVAQEQLETMVAGHHQGIVLKLRRPRLADFETMADALPENLWVALDKVEDPHNLGAVARSAAAFGAMGMILPRHGAADVTPGALRSSAGQLLRLRLVSVVNLSRSLRTLRESGWRIVGLDSKGERTIGELAPSPGTVLVVGNEKKGMRRLVRDACDEIVNIPTIDEVDSLNVSVAAGIALYQLSLLPHHAV